MVYINGASSLSPQNSLNYKEFIKEMLEYEDDFLTSVKPNYKDYMKPIAARRMSKTVKNGIICSQNAMQEANIEMPDAIIVGTGLGIVSDTEKFLEKMLNDNEQYLTPTSFIQSTHNTVAAQVALKIKCHNYNFTYVNRGFSFESALQDAIMHLNEGKKNILIGGADEMSKHYFHIIQKNGRWKKQAIKNTELLNYKTEGAICGEGVNFFVISSEKNNETYAEIKAMQMFYKPKNNTIIENKLNTFLEDNKINISEIDLIITGHSGDKDGDKIYNNLLKNKLLNKPVAYFKHLTGEYQTASSFPFWLGANILKTQKIPEFIMLNDKKVNEVKNILIYNHYFNINHSFVLLSSV